jgi:N-acetylglucosamine kinase-like BadF-type ATPase
MSLNTEYSIIGIDGGGTRTRGVLFKNGKIIAQSNAGTTRIGAVGVGESCERLLNVVIDLCEKSELESSEIDAIVIGQAGVWLDEEKRRSSHLLKTLGRTQKFAFNDLIVTSDAELAVEGAFEGGHGIALIVGTGSIAIGKLAKDKLIRCGGWGIELDDEGSGAWIGKEGLTAVVRAIDGRDKPTALTTVLTDLFPSIDLDNPRTIVKAYSERNFEYHMLTPSVMRCAEDGDEICKDIIRRSCFHLLELLDALSKQFKTKTVPVALMGGIIEADTILSKMLEIEIDKKPILKRVQPKGTALDGAIAIGQRLIEEME